MIKKNSSSYFLFASDMRTQLKKEMSEPGSTKNSMKDLNETIAARWKNADEATKERYQRLAAEDKDRYQREVQAMKDAGTWVERSDEASKTILPAARIKRIVKLDTEVKHMNREALFLITKAAELFTKQISQKTSQLLEGSRTTIRVQHLCYAVHNDPLFEFLVDDFKAVDAAVLPKRGAGGGRRAATEPASSRPIDQYF
jgi:DNA-directed RNA polymerase I subunit RPA43